MNKNSKKLMRFFGVTLFIQAVTALIGGTIFMGSFEMSEITGVTLLNISETSSIGYISIVLQMITAVVIIMLGVAMYKVSGHRNKTIAITALSLYIFEAVLLALAQVFLFGLIEVSTLFSVNGDTSLIAIGNILHSLKEFSGKIAMIPFGVGAILFYYLLLKAEVIPKWLALYGLVTVPFILISVPLMAFGIPAPFILLVPYVPFEFFTGIYVLVANSKNSNNTMILDTITK